jgi:AcrR family transcriptional regulator
MSTASRPRLERSRLERSRHSGSRPVRPRLPFDARRTQLLELGLRLFSSRAYDDVSIEEVADRAGISKGLLYHYFGSKRDFYVEVVRHAAAELEHRTEPDPTLTPAERARASIERYVAFVEEHGGAYVALLRSGVGSDPRLSAIVEQTRTSIVARLLSSVGLVAPRPTFRFVVKSWIGFVEAATLEWLERREVSRDVLVQTLVEALSASLAIATRLDPQAGVQTGVPSGEPARRACDRTGHIDPTGKRSVRSKEKKGHGEAGKKKK